MTWDRQVVVLGDVVLDRDVEGTVERVCPDAPAPVLDVERETSGPGGAGLTALLCRDQGVEVTLVAPFGADADGELLAALLEEAGVRVLALGQDGSTRRKTRVRAGGQSLVRLDSGGPARPTSVPDEAFRALDTADVVLVSCYGAGVSAHEGLRAALARRARRRPVTWDPHPRGGRPVTGCALVTPNLAEARAHASLADAPGDVVARALVRDWATQAVAVTAGASGAWLATTAGEPLFVPATPVPGDPCGAGDRFAAAAAVALAAGQTTSEAVVTAVGSASAFVAAGGASGYRARQRGGASGGGAIEPGGAAGQGPVAAAPVEALVARTRAAGGTVVATGGCFDVLHAGHVQSLEAARRLGDALVVLLNSDASTRRLKGPGRPVHCAADRARVLRGLACVDAVVVFDEDDPREALRRLRPQVWAKGGDYEGAELAEAELVRSWGGRVVLLPYLSGRSTTAILNEIR